MAGKWATASAMERAREWLVEAYPGETTEILETFDVAWPGWDGDDQGAIIRHGDTVDVVIVDGSYVVSHKPLLEQIADLVLDYHRLASDMTSVVRAYERLKVDAARPVKNGSNYDESALAVLEGMGPVRRRTDHHVVPEMVAESAPAPPLLDLLSVEPYDHVSQDGGAWLLPRDPGESDAEFELRKQLFGRQAPPP